MDDLVEKYIELRDGKAKIAAKYKEDVAKIDVILDKIEAYILETFTEQGIDSAKTPKGTAYKSVRSSATVADWDATLDFIKANNLWNLLKHDVAKKAVEEYRDEHNDLPPGLNWREEIVINVRRS